jgi:nucleoside-diphosphate-sugar epimerase
LGGALAKSPYGSGIGVKIHRNEVILVATGEAYSAREFTERAFALVGLEADDFIEIYSRFMRPAEVDYLLGDPQDTFDTLGWEVRTSFEDLVREMVEANLELALREKLLCDAIGSKWHWQRIIKSQHGRYFNICHWP